MNKPSNPTNQGFSLVVIIIIIAAIIAAAIIVWRVWDTNTNQQSQDSISNNQDNNNTEPVDEVDPNEGYVVIKEWGVRFKPVEGLEGVEYYRVDDENEVDDFFAFTTDSLANADANCAPESGNIVLGGITRSDEPFAVGNNRGPINGYYYFARAANAPCASLPELGPTTTRFVEAIMSLKAAE